jgi:hypothetical protein
VSAPRPPRSPRAAACATRRPWLLLLSLLSLALLTGTGCKPSAARKGHRVACSCTYLTDYDDTARVDVDACLPVGEPVEKEAAVCAGQSAHNHIDKCTCGPPSGPCDPAAADACKNR